MNDSDHDNVLDGVTVRKNVFDSVVLNVAVLLSVAVPVRGNVAELD